MRCPSLMLRPLPMVLVHLCQSEYPSHVPSISVPHDVHRMSWIRHTFAFPHPVGTPSRCDGTPTGMAKPRYRPAGGICETKRDETACEITALLEESYPLSTTYRMPPSFYSLPQLGNAGRSRSRRNYSRLDLIGLTAQYQDQTLAHGQVLAALWVVGQ